MRVAKPIVYIQPSLYLHKAKVIDRVDITGRLHLPIHQHSTLPNLYLTHTLPYLLTLSFLDSSPQPSYQISLLILLIYHTPPIYECSQAKACLGNGAGLALLYLTYTGVIVMQEFTIHLELDDVNFNDVEIEALMDFYLEHVQDDVTELDFNEQ